MGNLLQQGPSPGQKKSEMYQTLFELPPEQRTFERAMREAIRLGSEDPVARATEFLKIEKADRDRIKDLMPDPTKLPTGTVPVTPQILDLLSQANLPTTGLSEPAPLPAPLGRNAQTGAPLSLPELATLVPPIGEVIAQGRLPGPVVGSQPELTLFGGPAREALPQQPIPGRFVPTQLVTQAGQQVIKKQTPEGERFAPQVETKYVPVDDAGEKFQLMSIDRVSGATKPVLRDGKPIILTEKQVLIAEGKKAQSLIDPFETKLLGKLGESEAVRLTEMKKTALDAVQSKEIIDQGLALVNAGIYTGSAANIKLVFNKWLQEAGVKVGNTTVANTEAYAGLMGLQVGKIIKNFGSGTGLSDADREFAEKIAGGKITMTEASIRKLLDINRRLADFTVSEYNRQAIEAKRALEEKDFFRPIENTAEPALPPQSEFEKNIKSANETIENIKKKYGLE